MRLRYTVPALADLDAIFNYVCNPLAAGRHSPPIRRAAGTAATMSRSRFALVPFRRFCPVVAMRAWFHYGRGR